MTSKRQLAAIMFTDIAGFSAMMHDNEVYAKKILARQRQTLESTHRNFDGKILQYIGDGTLSIFGSAVEAVECAVAMQVELRKDPYVPLRIGIHTGDITYDETGAFGDGVNITSRVEELCIPGGVYITGKVYDDIRNHAWLTAMPLGPYNLHNIDTRISIYAITSRGLPVPETGQLEEPPGRENEYLIAGQKNKFTAAILALFLGMFGAHRFYLGQRKKGILYLVAFGIAMAAAIEENAPIIAILAIVAFVDSVLLFVMPKAEFDQKYNQISTPAPPIRRPAQVAQKAPVQARSALGETFQKAKRYFDRGKYQEAVVWFDRVLDQDDENIDAHYYLASCFSLLHDEENAYIHLGLAVKYGFRDFDRIDKDINLYFLKTRPGFSGFVDNGYRLVEALPEPKPDLLQTDRFDPSILEKIELLGDQLEKGELTQEEFQLKKERILRGD